MFKFMMNEVLDPLINRIGTAAGAVLLARGIPGDTVETIVLGLVAALGVGADLGYDAVRRKRAGK